MPQAQQLGRYHLLDRIAYGGMAEIFRAQTFDAQGNVHLVAIKRLLPHLVTDSEFLTMLIDEAKVSALLQHRNIAHVYELGQAGDTYYLAMEYIDGKDLRAVLDHIRKNAAGIAPEHAAWIAMEAATALHAAHTQCDPNGVALRIVHRDVSPSNILCSYRGDVKLCDFGIAKAIVSRAHTRVGVVKGKVKYMSPEQALGRKVDHRSDLFSLGSVLYEMLTLQAPFQAPTEVELIFAVRDARKRPLRELAPACPEPLVEIVERAMARSFSARYQSGEQMAGDLRRFLEAYKPGYRRSHFARFMQRGFASERDSETQRLRHYTIGQADNRQLGQNLLAEVLGSDALFSRFTPVHHLPLPVSRNPAARTTRLRGASAPDRASRPATHARSKGLPEVLHNAPTQLFSLPQRQAPEQTQPESARGLHDSVTHIFDPTTLPGDLLETVDETPPPVLMHDTAVVARADLAGTPPLHDTMVVARAELAGTPALIEGPSEIINTNEIELIDEEESISIPLGDDDLEPL